MIDNAVVIMKERNLPNQLLLEYMDKDAAAATADHEKIIQLRYDLRDVLELDCNERLLLDEPHSLINEWMLRSKVLQDMIV